MRRGSYIVIEGGDHVGKTTQVERLAAALDAIKLREPGDTPIGEAVRELLLDPEVDKQPETQALLHAAQRRELADTKIRPMLENGHDVVSDRSWISSAVYPCVEGMDFERVLELNRFALQELIKPDLCIILDADPQTVFGRVGDREPDHYERKSMDFHQQVREGYLSVGGRVGAAIIDAEQEVNAVTQQIMYEIETKLPGRTVAT